MVWLRAVTVTIQAVGVLGDFSLFLPWGWGDGVDTAEKVFRIVLESGPLFSQRPRGWVRTFIESAPNVIVQGLLPWIFL